MRGPGGEPVVQYVRHLRRRALAQETIDRRATALRRLQEWIAPKELADAEPEEIEAFLDSRRIGAKTRYGWLSHFSCFYDWAVAEGLASRNPVARIQRPKLRRLLPRPISEGNLAMALESADRMMRAWLVLGAFAGFRCVEISRLDVDWLLWHEGVVRVLGKGAKERIVPIHPLVDDVLHEFGLPKHGAVFTRPRGGRWPAAVVSSEISCFFEGLGIPATAHNLRHRFGTMTYAACRDIRVVQELMGHSSPSTTAIYAAYSRTEAKAAVLALPLAADNEPTRGGAQHAAM